MDIRQSIIILSILMLFWGLISAATAGAKVLDDFVLVDVTDEALESGFTVKSSTKQLWIPIFPKQYSEKVKIIISDESAAPFALPANTQPVTGFFKFSVRRDKGTKITITDQPVLLSFAINSRSGFQKKVYFYDEDNKQWVPVDSKITDTKKNIIQATVKRGSGHVVVLETLPKEWTSASAVVIDRKSGKTVYEKDSQKVRSIASLTKLMTALVFLEHNPGWDKIVTIKSSDFVGGSYLPVNSGDKVTVRDLFYAMLIGSKNNAGKALVRSTGLTDAQFVKAMNDKAAKLKLKNTKFVEPTGLDAGNVSTAAEIAQIAEKAFAELNIANATAQKYYQVKTVNNGKRYWVKSTSKTMLDRDLKVVGTKTGVIDSSGYNLVTEAKSDTRELIALVLGADEKMNYEEVYYLLKKYL